MIHRMSNKIFRKDSQKILQMMRVATAAMEETQEMMGTNRQVVTIVMRLAMKSQYNKLFQKEEMMDQIQSLSLSLNQGLSHRVTNLLH